jgi:hypothetical protein
MLDLCAVGQSHSLSRYANLSDLSPSAMLRLITLQHKRTISALLIETRASYTVGSSQLIGLRVLGTWGDWPP